MFALAELPYLLFSQIFSFTPQGFSLQRPQWLIEGHGGGTLYGCTGMKLARAWQTATSTREANCAGGETVEICGWRWKGGGGGKCGGARYMQLVKSGDDNNDAHTEFDRSGKNQQGSL
ncbi:hypothetical protein SESBI_34675 [Sesbania bispinosa]|nr:hypothetical protein SESBI_34675 [Sesbania bispinosa]